MSDTTDRYKDNGKISIKLDFSIHEGMAENQITFTHPQLTGALHVKGSSLEMLQLMLQYLDVVKPATQDPVSQLVTSASKLADGVIGFKELISK